MLLFSFSHSYHNVNHNNIIRVYAHIYTFSVEEARKFSMRRILNAVHFQHSAGSKSVIYGA